MTDFTPGFVWNLYPGETVNTIGAWRFNDAVPPSAPAMRVVSDGGNLNRTEVIGYAPVVGSNTRLDGIRKDGNKSLKLLWAKLVDVRFFYYLHYMYVFSQPLRISIPVFSHNVPSVLYTPDTDNTKYLYTYYGMERNWKSGSVVVYKNGSVIDSGFTIDYTNGSITFTTIQSAGDVIKATWTYEAPFIITQFNPRFYPYPGKAMCVAPSITLSEIEWDL